MQLRLHNTLTRRKEVFQPLDPNRVRLYVCGPTVYQRIHVGNARAFVVFDVLYRLLRHLYGEQNVVYVRNITDIDDKIIDQARTNGEDIRALTERTTAEFHEDLAALGCLPPTHEPRATEHVARHDRADRQQLIERGHAYAAEGHVLFSVPSMPAYGRLSGRNRDEQIAGARVDVAPYKRDPADFVLWKPSADDQPGWDSPWGRGRPGWHIECSAMSEAFLAPLPFDIHAGGLDLIFPHHENEIAQSCCAHGIERDGAVLDAQRLPRHARREDVEERGQCRARAGGIGDVVHAGRGRALCISCARTIASRRILSEEVAGAKLELLLRSILSFTFGSSGGVSMRQPPTSKLIEALADDLNTPAGAGATSYAAWRHQTRHRSAERQKLADAASES